MKYIHPFPARMAPEIAINKLEGLHGTPIVLDPMVGSGTVVSAAVRKGFKALGRDMDPLAVLISRTACYNPCREEIELSEEKLWNELKNVGGKDVVLPWIDKDEETRKFIDYWFSKRQQYDLRRIAYILERSGEFEGEVRDIFRVALSRIIITKDKGASLARDVSHSRPHKVMVSSDYNVVSNFFSSVSKVKKYFEMSGKAVSEADVSQGDARSLCGVDDRSVDLVITSPPYLNAIDYMRGHRFSLVWLGMTAKETRGIRSESIGAERAKKGVVESYYDEIFRSYGDLGGVPSRIKNMLVRYCCDLRAFSSSIRRVVKEGGEVVVVMGDSKLKGVDVRNSMAVIESLRIEGFSITEVMEREIPLQHRYLPTPEGKNSALSNRMRKEVVITAVSG